jgi:hypothetical protein
LGDDLSDENTAQSPEIYGNTDSTALKRSAETSLFGQHVPLIYGFGVAGKLPFRFAHLVIKKIAVQKKARSLWPNINKQSRMSDDSKTNKTRGKASVQHNSQNDNVNPMPKILSINSSSTEIPDSRQPIQKMSWNLIQVEFPVKKQMEKNIFIKTNRRTLLKSWAQNEE